MTEKPQEQTHSTNVYFINQVPEGRIEMVSKSHRMVLSVDLAKSVDKTAFTVTEVKPLVRQSASGSRIRLASFIVHNITRLEPDRDFRTYADIAKIIHKAYHDKRIWLVKGSGKEVEPQLLVDAGGVGDAVCDDLEAYMGLNPVRYKLTRGTSHVHQYSLRNWTVPRPLIFQMADSAFGDDRIAVRPDLKLARDLMEEFRNLKRETNEETGSVRVVHREGKHDDMAICLASTVWWSTQPKTGPVSTVRAAPYGADVAIRDGVLDPRSLPVVSRKVKPWRYS
ncbi:MAG: hypothetical protein WKF53_11955 [Rubrobacter sp.]